MGIEGEEVEKGLGGIEAREVQGIEVLEVG